MSAFQELENKQLIKDEEELEEALNNVRLAPIEDCLIDLQQFITNEAACIDRCARVISGKS